MQQDKQLAQAVSEQSDPNPPSGELGQADGPGGGDPQAGLDEAALERLETQDWLDALRDVLHLRGGDRVTRLLSALQLHAQRQGVVLPVTSQTPFVNTITPDREPDYPGNMEIERRIKSLIRWNAMAMVVRANKESSGIGGHISTYASAATLYEVGFNHFFRGPDHPSGGDLVYFQGHASPGIYARAYLEGRLSDEQLLNFRRELRPPSGLSSYPHPWLMPEFWQFPTVSMGLGPIMAIYRARFMRYLEDRGLKEPGGQKVWCFLGDGETDEPESLGAITLASREKLDNLIFVVNCNLQRLDGPVRGNGNIVQELERLFRGAGWHVLKVLWGRSWDPLLARDTTGRLIQRFNETVDGWYQKYRAEDGAYIREHFFGTDPELKRLVANMSDEDIWRLRRGGHDPVKVYTAYHNALRHEGAPTVILALTIKGYGLGEAGEGQNITHQQKKLNEEELLAFRDRFDIPLTDEQAGHAPFYRPPADSPEMQYLHDRRRALGGYLPQRRAKPFSLHVAQPDVFDEYKTGTREGRGASTTMVLVQLLGKLLRDKAIGKLIVPIVPDEARTFGMEGLFRAVGIYSHVGQLYEPVDSESLMYYKEAIDGQILEEGITEAGSMCSMIASGTSYYVHQQPTIPFFIYYSMFGFQRIGDLIWAAGDMRTRGFLVGGTAGRTTLAGEGLQHQDGNSHIAALTLPNVVAYDPAYAYEIATIIKDGLRRMFAEDEDVFYYLTVENENYDHPPMPDREGVEDGILKGMYLLRPAAKPRAKRRAQLLASGAILNEAVKAQALLADQFNVHADVWSVTSAKNLHLDAQDCEHHALHHPDEAPPKPYITQCLEGQPGPVVAASDYLKVLFGGLAAWIPGTYLALGTDGFGRSEDRASLRDFFEVDAKHIALAVLTGLVRDGQMDGEEAKRAMDALEIAADKANPVTL